ncbi:MAG TPA: hypothetical protein VH684_04340 [Xanthobacteraceae bacterium]|jgi:hypothetical protein
MNVFAKAKSSNEKSFDVTPMTTLSADSTGLPGGIFVWVSPGEGIAHGPRMKVSNIRGKFSNTDNFSISISNSPTVVEGRPKKFSSEELRAIAALILLNKDLLLKYWESDIMDSPALLREFKRLETNR